MTQEPRVRKLLPFIVAGVVLFCLIGCAVGLLSGLFTSPVAPAPTPTPTSITVVVAPPRPGGIVVVVPTPASGVPTLTADTDVGIHSGPGVQYDLIGYLQSGQTAGVVGQNADKSWWALEVTAAPGGQGWVSAQYVTTANTEKVPVLAAPPAPAPTPSPPAAFSGWRGEYFNNRDLLGAPVLVRNDPEVNFNWGTNRPAPGVSPAHFSVRWTITPSLTEGTYRFTIWVDDGARLFLDDRMVIDGWQEGPPRKYLQDVKLAQGPHAVRLDYFQASGGALAQLSVGYVPPPPPPLTPTPSQPPAAVIAGPTQAQTGQTVSFSGRRSTAARGSQLAAYAWDFGDGTQASGVDVTHVYGKSGSYDISLVVTDTRNLSDRTTQQLSVTQPPAQSRSPKPTAKAQPAQPTAPVSKPGQGAPPTAWITVLVDGKPVAGSPIGVQMGQIVTLDGRGSQPGGKIMKFVWAIGGATQAVTGAVQKVKINAPGGYPVTLTVTDSSGLQDSASVQIQATGASPAPQ